MTGELGHDKPEGQYQFCFVISKYYRAKYLGNNITKGERLWQNPNEEKIVLVLPCS